MTDDDEREALIRRLREAQATPLQRKTWGSNVYEWTAAEIDCLLRRLDEARKERDAFGDALQVASDEITRLRARCEQWERDYAAVVEEMEGKRRSLAEPRRPSAPIRADVMELARRVVRKELGLHSDAHVHAVACAIQLYGDERARDAIASCQRQPPTP